MSLGLYEEGLRDPEIALTVRYGDGAFETLDLRRWLGQLTRGDASLLARAGGNVLDIGCGPGRLTTALALRGRTALGIDVAATAVALTQRSGGAAVQRSVFAPVPREGQWHTALLADGNIGIGGDPARLLRRVRELLHPRGEVLVELDDGGHRRGSRQARIEAGANRVGAWFPWAHVGAEGIASVAAGAGLRAAEIWSVRPPAERVRHFARLVAPR